MAFSPPPPAEAEVSLLRVRLFAVIIAAVFGILIARLWFLQVLGGGTFRAQATGNQSLRTAAPPNITVFGTVAR